ncbi:hypothetical protein CLV33_101143 [Jejuia pallidilutea]|uniref:Uncharacterized protein n=1 Tax=Jejuia pallidilutea TaxID=504487 RepID=A0A362XAI3_9FLAO|nr:hypothetical protein [Jejuia pallidilutea]PQV51221.1 hypothetical protein CLV33_101143 [Jejuia pallidilutea]
MASKQHQLGYQQRNELITHVLSGYKNDEKLLIKKKEWEDIVMEQRVVQWLYDMMRDRLDVYGYFENPEEIETILKMLIKKAERMEMFEKANILNHWRLKLIKA